MVPLKKRFCTEKPPELSHACCNRDSFHYVQGNLFFSGTLNTECCSRFCCMGRLLCVTELLYVSGCNRQSLNKSQIMADQQFYNFSCFWFLCYAIFQGLVEVCYYQCADSGSFSKGHMVKTTFYFAYWHQYRCHWTPPFSSPAFSATMLLLCLPHGSVHANAKLLFLTGCQEYIIFLY